MYKIMEIHIEKYLINFIFEKSLIYLFYYKEDKTDI